MGSSLLFGPPGVAPFGPCAGRSSAIRAPRWRRHGGRGFAV